MVIGIEDCEHRLEFASIKPETVILPTMINPHLVFWTYYDGFHLLKTDRALAIARLPILPFTQLRQQSARFRFAVYQQLDLTGIQPDPTTGKAVVDLYFL
jgi:hypothetical protein